MVGKDSRITERTDNVEAEWSVGIFQHDIRDARKLVDILVDPTGEPGQVVRRALHLHCSTAASLLHASLQCL